MITKWRLGNFKSVRETVELEFSPLTILVGPNSSGKSTVIQSIQVAAQTLSAQREAGDIVLNGNLRQLGNFKDLVHHDSISTEATIGFELTLTEQEHPVVTWYWNVHCDFIFGPPAKRDAEGSPLSSPCVLSSHIKCNAVRDLDVPDWEKNSVLALVRDKEKYRRLFSMTSEEYENLRPELADKTGGNIAIHISRTLPSDRAAAYQLTDVEASGHHPTEWLASLVYELDDGRESDPSYDPPSSSETPVGCLLQGFFPSKMALLYDERVLRAQTIVDTLSDFADLGEPWEESELRRRFESEYVPFIYESDWWLPSNAVQMISSAVDEVEAGVTATGRLKEWNDKDRFLFYSAEEQPGRAQLDIEVWRDLVRGLNAADRRRLRALLAANRDNLVAAIVQDREADRRLRLTELPKPLRGGIGQTISYFSNKVRYLGPLRKEPEPLHGTGTGMGYSEDIGLSGENTAAVLNSFGLRKIAYYPPSRISRLLDPNESAQQPMPVYRAASGMRKGRPLGDNYNTTEEAPLREAVTEWLCYLDVAKSVQTVDKGRSGYELDVASVEGGPWLDLTQVGVGVSQVLPILVMGLLAPQNGTLIFEQPELHLHPAVQTRLADFFWLLARSGEQQGCQCIIETHSEYLVNRLRLLTASCRYYGDPVETSVYSVEMAKGASQFRRIAINKYGAIEDWPKGFFDQSSDTAEQILRAAIQKREDERNSKNG